MDKPALRRMTWKEAEAALRGNPVLLLPMGSFAQHGPTAPMADYRYADELAVRIAAASGAVALPAVSPLGPSGRGSTQLRFARVIPTPGVTPSTSATSPAPSASARRR